MVKSFAEDVKSFLVPIFRVDRIAESIPLTLVSSLEEKSDSELLFDSD